MAPDLELKSAVLRCVLLVFSLISEPGGRDALLGLLLPPISDSLASGHSAATSYSVLCGKVVLKNRQLR
jgi:hypothetical protein